MFKCYTSIAKTILFFLVSGVLFAPPASAQQDNFSMKSKIFQETREIVVHLPENYDPNSKEGYPVFYMLDADQETDEIAAQRADDLPEVIVIAIHNVRRGMDFLPHHMSSKRDGKQVFGNGGKFLSFIKDELMPLVQKKFRTNGRRFFHGHSWAGQFVTYALSESPELFDGFFITSPSIGEYGDQTFSNLKRVFKQDLDFPAFVYVSVGGNERPRLKTDYDRLTTVLKQHLPKKVKLVYEINEGAIHDNSGSISIPKAMKLYFSTAPATTIQEAFPVLEGPYLGQKPPGLTPEVFAPGIVSTEHHEWGLVFTPDMKEFYFSRRNNESGKDSHFVLKSENNRWHETILDTRMGGAISPDGKTMHNGKRYRERTDDGWSELKSLGAAFEDIDIMRLTSSFKGTYVFDDGYKDGKAKIRYSRLINGVREAPKPLSKEINAGKQNVHPFIAPDESYILWDSKRDDGYGGSDIYVSFRQENGSWGTAINLGDKVNTSTSQRGGYVTPDGKYLFFNGPASTGKGDVFWVDAQIIENLRPKE